MKIRHAIVLAAALQLAACNPLDALQEGQAHAQAVAVQLEKATGVKSFVGFNWNNGVLTSVNVTFEGVPAGLSLPELIEKSSRAVEAEFKAKPRQMIVGFMVRP